MDDVFKYLEDKKFVRWVYFPDTETEAYWAEYFRLHPGEERKARQARLILLPLKTKNYPENPDELYKIFTAAVQKIDREKKKKKRLNAWLSFTKYAAVALIFLSVGILWENLTKPSGINMSSDWQDLAFTGGESRLIIANGKSIIIPEKESNVVYDNGQIIINKQDTIGNKRPDEENNINQLVIPYGKNASLRLPDGTMAYLNAGSRLIYPSFFEKDKREVFLVGEAFFEVAHNPEQPFFVKTNDMNIEAIGTSFNVSAYPVDQVIEVALLEGKIGIRENSFSFLKKQQILQPGQLASFNRTTGATAIRMINLENYVSWHKGYLNFESTDLSRIVLKLERYYNIRIRLADPLLGQRIITGKLKLKEEKDKVMEVLASTASSELVKINEQSYELK